MFYTLKGEFYFGLIADFLFFLLFKIEDVVKGNLTHIGEEGIFLGVGANFEIF